MSFFVTVVATKLSGISSPSVLRSAGEVLPSFSGAVPHLVPEVLQPFFGDVCWFPLSCQDHLSILDRYRQLLMPPTLFVVPSYQYWELFVGYQVLAWNVSGSAVGHPFNVSLRVSAAYSGNVSFCCSFRPSSCARFVTRLCQVVETFITARPRTILRTGLSLRRKGDTKHLLVLFEDEGPYLFCHSSMTSRVISSATMILPPVIFEYLLLGCIRLLRQWSQTKEDIEVSPQIVGGPFLVFQVTPSLCAVCSTQSHFWHQCRYLLHMCGNCLVCR